MPKIPATLDKTLRVNAPIQKVYDYFSSPELRNEDSIDVEVFEILEPNKARWLFKEERERGMTFQPEMIVSFQGNGSDRVEWKSEGGNVDVEGRVELKAISDQVTEIHYRETMAPDLPINRLLAKIFKPIVAHKVKGGLAEYLDKVVERFGKA